MIEDNFAEGSLFEFHDDADGLTGLIAQLRNPFDFFLVHEPGNGLDKDLLVDLIRNIVDHKRLTPVAKFLKMRVRAHDDATASGSVAFANPFQTVNDRSGRKVRCRDERHHVINRGFRVL